MENATFTRRELHAGLDTLAHQPAARATKQDRLALNLETVANVTKAYIRCKCLSPIVAMVWDQSDRSPRWSPTTAHFIADTEQVVRKTLRNRADKADLEAAWSAFVLSEGEQTVLDRTAVRIINILGGAFRHAGLHPRVYFRDAKVYRNRPERRNR